MVSISTMSFLKISPVEALSAQNGEGGGVETTGNCLLTLSNHSLYLLDLGCYSVLAMAFLVSRSLPLFGSCYSLFF